MSYTDLRDFSPEYAASRGDLRIQVEKLGGGTLGRDYDGVWRYVVSDQHGTELVRAQDFKAGTPLSHHVVSMRIAEYFDDAETHTTSTNWETIYYPHVMVGTVAPRSEPRRTRRFTVGAHGFVMFNAEDRVPDNVIGSVSRWLRRPTTNMTPRATLYRVDEDRIHLFAGPDGTGYVATSRAEDQYVPELDRFGTFAEAERAYMVAVARADADSLYDHEIYIQPIPTR